MRYIFGLTLLLIFAVSLPAQTTRVKIGGETVAVKGTVINTKRLSQLLKMPVIETVARSGEGKKELLALASKEMNAKKSFEPVYISYGPDLDETLNRMESLISTAKLLADYLEELKKTEPRASKAAITDAALLEYIQKRQAAT